MHKRFECLLVLFLIQACNFSSEVGAPSKDLVIATGIPIGEFQPFSSRAGIAANLVELVYPVLFRLSEDGEIVPELAEKVEWQKEKMQLRVWLKSANADDLIHTIGKANELRGGDFREGLKNLQSIEKKSPTEVVFSLKKNDRAFLYLLSLLPIVPEREKLSNLGDFKLQDISEDQITLSRFTPSREKINKITVKVIPSPRRAIRELVAGNIDMLIFANLGDYQMLSDLPELRVGELSTRMIYMMLENKALNAVKNTVNLAELNQRIDRESMLKSLGSAEFTPASIPVPPANPISSELGGTKATFTAPAHGAVTQALSFLGFQSRDRMIARLLKRQLEEFGINLELISLTPKEFETEIYHQKSFSWVLMPINIKDSLMTNYLIFHSPEGEHSLNFSGYRNAEFDKYIEEARYAGDNQMAGEAFKKSMAALMEDPPSLFLFWVKTPIVYRNSCSGHKLNAAEFFTSLKDVRCEPYAQN